MPIWVPLTIKLELETSKITVQNNAIPQLYSVSNNERLILLTKDS